MKPADIESRLRQVAWPAPPADLRARVLSAIPVTVPAVSWSDRVWFSRAWRLAAVAAVLILAVLESMSGPAQSPAAPASARAVAEARFVDETARQAGLSPEQAAALARRAVAAERPARSGIGFGGIALEDLDSGGEPR
jgi:type VI protein secretion system component VasF